MKYDWMGEASCAGVLDSSYSYPSKVKEKKHMPVLLKFAEDYCQSCSVKSECLDSASEDDLAYTVRGGQIPSLNANYTPKNKSEESKRNRIRDYELDDETYEKFVAFVKRGVCKNSHVIQDFSDLVLKKRRDSRGLRQYPYCVHCQRTTWRRLYHKRAERATMAA